MHVLQDAQINEKKELERKRMEKELQLEQIMLKEDAKKFAELKQKEQEWKDTRDKYASELKEGLKYREMKKLIEAERIENEAQAIAMAQKLHKQEEDAKNQEQRQRKIQIRKEFQDTITASEEFKKRAEDQKRAAEMKAQEYMRQKAERDKELEKERRFQREQKQKEIDRILARQKELLETKQESEMTNLRRIQEQKDREFRMKAMEAAVKRKEMEMQMLEARAVQIEETKRMKAERDEIEILERQEQLKKVNEEKEKQKCDKANMHQLREKYRQGSQLYLFVMALVNCNFQFNFFFCIEIVTQIQQKVQTRKTKQMRSVQELEEQRKQELDRKENIRKVIASKVEEMRESKIPEHIIRDVERQLKLCHD